MISQTRDVVVIPVGEDLFTVFHNFTALQLFEFLHDNILVPIIGNFIAIFLTGITLTLGVSSILLLSSKKPPSTLDIRLRTYTAVVLFLSVAFQIEMLLITLGPLTFYFHSLHKAFEPKTNAAVCVTLAVLAGSTDGLLTWRCFMVQRVLANSSSKWGNLFWIFPAFLWLSTIAMALTAFAAAIGNFAWYDITAGLAVGANVLLNLYATIFISIRLLLYRRAIIAYLGSAVLAAHHIYIIGIFLESAAINLPVTAICAIWIGIGSVSLSNTLFPIAVASQAFASVLIIHQAALGRVLSWQKQCEVKRLVEIAPRNTSQGPEPTA